VSSKSLGAAPALAGCVSNSGSADLFPVPKAQMEIPPDLFPARCREILDSQ
jgi:hypothetical protein